MHYCLRTSITRSRSVVSSGHHQPRDGIFLEEKHNIGALIAIRARRDFWHVHGSFTAAMTNRDVEEYLTDFLASVGIERALVDAHTGAKEAVSFDLGT